MAPMTDAYADEVYNHDPDTRETHKGVFEEFSQEGDFCFLPKDRLGSIGPTQKQKGNCCWAFVTLSLIRTMLFYLLTPELFKIFRGVSLMELLVRVHCFSPSVLPSWFNNMRDAFTVVEIFGLYSWDHPINEDTGAGIREGDFKFHVGKFECLDREISTPQVPNPTNQKILDLAIRSLITGKPVYGGLKVGSKFLGEWHKVSGGIYFEEEYERATLDSEDDYNKYIYHVVLIVGFGFRVRDNTFYFIIQNTEGIQWGFGGFARASVDCFLQVGCPDFPSFKVHDSQEWISAWIDALVGAHAFSHGRWCPASNRLMFGSSVRDIDATDCLDQHTYAVGSPCCQSILPPTTKDPFLLPTQGEAVRGSVFITSSR
ncbi:hypothetical protein OROGR_026538 [Orobanche gracilis]